MRFLKTCVEEEEEGDPKTEPLKSRVNSLGGEEPAKETEKPGNVVLEQPSKKIFQEGSGQQCRSLVDQERCSSRWVKCDQENSLKREEALAGLQVGDPLKRGDSDEGEAPCRDVHGWQG